MGGFGSDEMTFADDYSLFEEKVVSMSEALEYISPELLDDNWKEIWS